jgi:hypothetical protein
MFEEIRYRWKQRQFLKMHKSYSRSYEEMPEDPEIPVSAYWRSLNIDCV